MADSADSAELNIAEFKESQTFAESVASCHADHSVALQQLGLVLEEEGYVKWRPDCAGHPRNWSIPRKAFDTSLILLLDLFT